MSLTPFWCFYWQLHKKWCFYNKSVSDGIARTFNRSGATRVIALEI